MLVLTVHKNEPLQIGDARIFVTQGSFGKFRIAIDAPRHVEVIREKVMGRRNEDKKRIA